MEYMHFSNIRSFEDFTYWLSHGHTYLIPILASVVACLLVTSVRRPRI